MPAASTIASAISTTISADIDPDAVRPGVDDRPLSFSRLRISARAKRIAGASPIANEPNTSTTIANRNKRPSKTIVVRRGNLEAPSASKTSAMPVMAICGFLSAQIFTADSPPLVTRPSVIRECTSMSCPWSGNGRGRSRVALMALKIAVVAPMPIAVCCRWTLRFRRAGRWIAAGWI